MALESNAILDAVVSHAMTTGYFDAVNQHEPKNAPGRGLNCAVWVQRIRPVARASGLSVVSALLVVNLRLTINMLREPQDDIDVDMLTASDALLNNFMGDFSLDGLVRNVDVFGGNGYPLDGAMGYYEQDKIQFRSMVIQLPLIINDVWELSA